MVQRKRINENITLSYIPMNKLKTTTVGFYIHRPLCKEDAAKNAVLAMVLRRGSKDYPDMEAISKRLDELYGSKLSAGISKKGEDQIISFEAECISDRYVPGNEPLLGEVMKLLCGIIFEPRVEDGKFNQEIFAIEQKNLIDRIRSEVNDKRSYANERMCGILCKDDAYSVSRLGDEQSAASIDSGELYEYYKKIITGSAIDIYFAGELDFDKVTKVIEGYIDGRSFSGGEIPTTDIVRVDNAEPEKVTEKMDVTQGKLSMGFTTGIKSDDERYWALLVANSIFGSGAHSKLFNNVREKLSLAYYAGSQMHRFKGFIAVNAGVEFENFQKAYDETLLQLDLLKKGDVSEQEFTAAKMFLINNLDSYYDDQLYMQSFYLSEQVAGTDYDIEYYKKKIEAVSLKEAVAAAQNIKLQCAYFLTGKEA